MQYTEAILTDSFAQDYLRDLFLQQLGDIGFDSFVCDDQATSPVIHAYIQSEMLNEQNLRSLAAAAGVEVLSVTAVPDQNWNAAWEAEHPMMELPLGVRIVPHCAFGAGHHQTTGMMIDELLLTDLSGKSVLDMGCGTGVLGIFAAKRGAAHVVAVDIDDHSVDNARENAALNGVEMDVRLADTPPEGAYHLILANIHRNILLAQMPDYARLLRSGGQLWLSGFYAEDVPILTSAAEQLGLHATAVHSNEEWRMIQMSKL